MDNMQEVVVSSILDSLQDYLTSKDVDFLFRMGSKLSFVAYTLDSSVDVSLVEVVPSLIQFTEIIHELSEDPILLEKYDELIVAFLHDLHFWLKNYFIEKKPEKIASNIISSLITSVENIRILLDESDPSVENIDDIFF